MFGKVLYLTKGKKNTDLFKFVPCFEQYNTSGAYLARMRKCAMYISKENRRQENAKQKFYLRECARVECGVLARGISLAHETLFAQEAVNSELFSEKFRGQLLEL